MDVKVPTTIPIGDTATYDSEDKVIAAAPHGGWREEHRWVEANFSMTLTVDKHGKPTPVAEFPVRRR